MFKDALKLQLGRTPKGKFKVIKLCKYGFPVVIKNPPVVNRKPFPTMYWLTCPYLVKKVSQLEERGLIEYFERKLKYDHRFKNRYLKAHNFERNLRKLHIPEDVPKEIKVKLLTVGIGGIEKPLGVKCLHLHLASYLAGISNPIGKEVYKKHLLAKECRDNYCGKRLQNL